MEHLLLGSQWAKGFSTWGQQAYFLNSFAALRKIPAREVVSFSKTIQKSVGLALLDIAIYRGARLE